ncbi:MULTISPECIES: polymer-forming cytoskeletal protein [unclassified Modicisalibacter]|uniref:bactofilin family protein n=1 Tax=unclassified Modicisalibacter TaxID=2679913 RepID=UPI001CCC97EF|nr:MULTISPECIES: polymer-forming cytoskeletal protein [unclassified Modicisalibacter]MBZ9559530.1 polymer-forming cytoskeletal protein [Modicisalibacter sp. R2A 31.J]MBZ9576982.1 polymer-forming cytoskeletal protein [Modicisalibacter sp. MOD 31.J]
MFNKSHRGGAAETPDVAPPERPAPPSGKTRRIATIGAATRVEGDIVGDEDLHIEGRVTGRVECKQSAVTIGGEGEVNGDVFAHAMSVAGRVEGRLIVAHKVTLRDSARVTGTIICPCLVLEDGGVFHGSVDMDPDNAILAEAFDDDHAASASTPAMSVPVAADDGGDDEVDERS